MPAIRILIIAALGLAPLAAHAQASPVAQVGGLAPQLVAFAGSQQNFRSLVNGLAEGAPVTLTTTLPNGVVQTVTFVPTAGPLPPLEIARSLERARQDFIGRGIAAPSAEQLGRRLARTAPTVGLAAAPATPPSPAAQLQQRVPASGFGLPNTSDSPFPRGASDTPVRAVPGVTIAPAPPPAAAALSAPSTGAAPAARSAPRARFAR